MAEKIKLADLIVSLGLDPEGFKRGADQAKSEAQKIGASFKKEAGGGLSFFQRQANGLKGAMSAVGKVGTAAMTGLGVAVAGVGVGAVALGLVSKKAFELAQMAAPLQSASAAFRALTKDIDGGATAMLASMREASGGLITNTNLMLQFNKAAQLISVDFAQQLPSAMESLGKVAAATGEDMTFLLDSLTVGVGRLSPMILDNLSIQVDLNQAYQDFADKNGLVAESLNKSQQQAALMAQVTQKLQENTASLPDTYGSASQAIGAFGTDIQNIREGIGLDLLPAFTELTNAGRSLMPAFESVGRGLAGAFAEITEVGKQFTRGLLAAFGVDFNTLAQNGGKWGQNFVVQLARGMASAIGAVIQVLNELGKVITFWLQPHSPPKLLPNLDKWGAGAANAYFEGWTEGNVSILRDLSKQVESFLRSSMAGDSNQAITDAVLSSRKALESALKSGGDVVSILPKKLQAYGKALVSVQSAESAVTSAQAKLNQVTAQYDKLLAPVNQELSEIAKRRQQIIDTQRKAELESIISDENAPALAKELAQMELREIELKNQQQAIEEQKDTAVSAAQEELTAAESLLKQQQEKLNIQQQLLQQQQENLDLLNSEASATDALSSATEGLSGVVGGLGGALDGIGGSMAGLMPLSTAFGSNISEIAEAVRAEFDVLGDSAFNLGLTWGGVMTAMKKHFHDRVQRPVMESPIYQWLEQHVPDILSILGKSWDFHFGLMSGWFKMWGDIGLSIMGAIGNFIKKRVAPVVKTLSENWSNVWWPSITKQVEKSWLDWQRVFKLARKFMTVHLPNAIQSLERKFGIDFSAIGETILTAQGKFDLFLKAVKGLWEWLQNHVFSFNIQTPSFPSLPGAPTPTDSGGAKDASSGVATVAPSARGSSLGAGMVGSGSGGGVNVDLSGAIINEPMDLDSVIMAVVSAVKREMATG